MLRHAGRLAVPLALFLLAGPGPRAEPPLAPAGVDGSLVICGGGKLPDKILDRFVELAGGEKAKLVVIPTASETADKDPADRFLAPWRARKPASVVVLHTRSRQAADAPQFAEPLREATGVWFGGGAQARVAEAYLGTAVEKELYALLKRGGVIGGTSAGAAIQSRVMIASGNPVARVERGFDLLPGSVIDQHFRQRNRQARLAAVVAKHPDRVGLGVDEGTALVVRGRELRVLGEGAVTVCLAGSAAREAKAAELKSGATADLTALRRAALARAAAPFPPPRAPVPEVVHGALVIVGGGGMPEDVTKRFIDLAGGPESLIVVLPTAVPDPIPENAGANLFTRHGAKNVRVLRARQRKDVEDPNNLETLQKAGGVWFGGGRQWRFVDAYENTAAHQAFREVLRRGGVIGGSSAGATIQGDYLCRGSPLNNTEMMCEGYERGLGFLPGTAIDQHFSQRQRLPDMEALKKTFPQLFGLGVDETTALVVRGHTATVMGKNQAHFFAPGRTAPVSLGAGRKYDFKAAQPVPE